MGASMSSKELAGWIAFENLYGFPDLFWSTTLICSTLEGLWSEHPRSVAQICPYFGAGIPPMSGDDMAERMRLMSLRT
jgi:hypothetical protein